MDLEWGVQQEINQTDFFILVDIIIPNAGYGRHI